VCEREREREGTMVEGNKRVARVGEKGKAKKQKTVQSALIREPQWRGSEVTGYKFRSACQLPASLPASWGSQLFFSLSIC